LLLRFFDPTEGSITLDGRDLRSMDPRQLRRGVGMVDQATLLRIMRIALSNSHFSYAGHGAFGQVHI
jgi:ABC-type transport system involved in Fe-S cluster assembly fused permease/ATPase subunit